MNDTMTNITKAAQDALEALDSLLDVAMVPMTCEGLCSADSAERWGDFSARRDALRAALQDKAGEVPDDVARYQAIRNGLVYIEPHESGEIYVAGESGVYTKSGAEFDAAIDAIAASQQKGGSAG